MLMDRDYHVFELRLPKQLIRQFRQVWLILVRIFLLIPMNHSSKPQQEPRALIEFVGIQLH